MSVSVAPGTSVCAAVEGGAASVPSPCTSCMGVSRVGLSDVACVWGVEVLMVVASPVALMAFNSCREELWCIDKDT